jgi:predicted DNA-binding protein (MmcQ/YjbR family)
VTEHFPFDEDTLVLKWKNVCIVLFKSMGKGQPSVNLKCDPERAEELRAEYDDIQPGFHGKTHWNTIALNDQFRMCLSKINRSFL